ncbi:MAG: hypothetical protein RBS36_11705 [Thiomicrospira sp.]|jgi:archaellum component FlaC|nr:hypothetical protein [Thiomicrospira sp.]
MKQMSVKLTINADGNIRGVVRDINNDLGNFKSQTESASRQTDKLGESLKRIGHYGKTSDNLCQQIS